METLSESAELVEEIKRSRFIARAAPVASSEAALAYLERVKDHEATHNCWAYRAGGTYRFSDDGEPGGTAGRPILGAIEKQGLEDVVVVVTRYYGGIKLGAGGLARAYGGTAARCLQRAARHVVVPQVELRIRVGFALTAAVHDLVQRHDLIKLGEEFSATGVTVQLRVPVAQREQLVRQLMDATRGEVEVVPLDHEPGD